MAVTLFRALWAALFACGALLEIIALARRAGGDTLSEQVWALRRIRWLRPLMWLVWGWLTLHFFT